VASSIHEWILGDPGARDLDAMTRLQQLGALFVRGGDLAPVLGEIVEAPMAISGAHRMGLLRNASTSQDEPIESVRRFSCGPGDATEQEDAEERLVEYLHEVPGNATEDAAPA
jgi:hypothetical protein